MNKKNFVVTIFGSSRPRHAEPEYTIAYELGKLLTIAGYVVCNGGYGGTMEASACGAKEAAGRTVGITCEFFGKTANTYTDETIVTKTLNERLMKLVDIADAYIVLKGGTGTLLELATVWEYMNKHVIAQKPIVVVGTFLSPVMTILKNELIWEGLGDATQYVSHATSPENCVAILQEKLKNAKKG
jgi:uncharacterized protein (TIGR00725 family)